MQPSILSQQGSFSAHLKCWVQHTATAAMQDVNLKDLLILLVRKHNGVPGCAIRVAHTAHLTQQKVIGGCGRKQVSNVGDQGVWKGQTQGRGRQCRESEPGNQSTWVRRGSEGLRGGLKRSSRHRRITQRLACCSAIVKRQMQLGLQSCRTCTAVAHLLQAQCLR